MPGIRNPFETLSFLPKKKYGNPLYGDTLDEIRQRYSPNKPSFFDTQEDRDPVEENRRRFSGLDLPKAPPSYLVDEETQNEEPGYKKRDWSGYLNDLKEIYSKQGSAQSAYESHLKDIPQQGKPSVWGRIVAGIVGAGTGYTEGASRGIAAGQAVYRRPYERQLEEWQNKEAGLSRQAEIEEKNLGRRLGYMKEVREVAKDEDEYAKIMQDYDIKKGQLRETTRVNDAKIKDYARRGMIKRTDPTTGRDVLMDPDTGAVVDLGESFDWKKFEEAKRHAGETERIAKGQLGVSQGSLGVAQGNLRIRGEELGLSKEAAGRAQEAAERAEAEEARRAATYEAGPHIPSAEQIQATRLAAAQVVAEYPDAAKFIDPKTGGIVPPGEALNKGYPTSAADQEHFKKFMLEVERKKKEALGLRRPGPAVGGLSGSKEVPRGGIIK